MKSKIKKVIRHSIFFRLFVSCFFLFKQVRVSLSVLIYGDLKNFIFCRGVKISSRCYLEIISDGIIDIQKHVWISHDVHMQTSSKILVGEETTIQRYATINGDVCIGNGCIIAPNVFISSGTHPFREYPGNTIRDQEKLIIKQKGSLDCLSKKIIIGDDCWLGINVVVCPGVKIGKGCIIGANSVVTKDVPDNTVMAGIPAKKIGVR
ncbi:acyltransferase [Allofrancisella guangzhouensis]|uniref:acyltransferase n=2 Tax=Allofrancisella guangzhouensis TaxID=594679 RepID=UPI00068A7195|nr:DapH/DapD/GlmU-related protein [Allofrancisella guangzhouensis]